MNKKYLNVILFSALMMGTAGTFTSCKDYDDDIDALNSRVDAVEKGIESLKTDFGALAYVKDVTFAGGKLTVTKSDNTTTTYDIPGADGNTTYELNVAPDAQNPNKVTITLKGSDGSTSGGPITFTDTSAESFDATKLTVDPVTNKVLYDGKETGVVLPKSEGVKVTKFLEDGVLVGWDISGTKLLISDALPITSFEYIPENILADWGERVIVFSENSYQPKVVDATKKEVVKIAPATTFYMPNQATPQYRVNPSSASLAQLAEEGKATILRSSVNKVTRTPGTFIEWKETDITNGVMTVILEADPALFTPEKDKLDEIALQFTAKEAGNQITTEYVGVINKTDEVDLVLTDNTVTAEDAKDDACHFATRQEDAENQAALIDDSNNPLATNAHLVQNVSYSKAIAGISLNELVHACDIKDDAGHKFFDYAAHSNLVLSFKAVSYKVGQTPQERYMKLEGTNNVTFKAVNYGDVNESCIGKAPIVLAELRDSHNGNALVSAAYIKLLIVGDNVEVKPEADITIEENTTLGLGCNDPVHSWKTNDEFMSKQVYPFSANDKLTALSKMQFHTIYTFTNTLPVGLTNKGIWDVKETIDQVDGKVNHEITFTLNEPSLKVGEYYAYAVYQRTTTDAELNKVDNSRNYPMNVVIKYTVTVDPVTFDASSSERVSNAWNADKTIASIYCETPGETNTAKIVGDLNELFYGGKVKFAYSGFDAAKYPSFVPENMYYKFVFSETNEGRKTVEGADRKLYQLAVDASNTKLYAFPNNVTVTDADLTDDRLVASLSGVNNEDIIYAETDIAKNLLNRDKRNGDKSFYAEMDIIYANGCDQVVPVTDGTFKVAFIRPVNIESNSSQFFTDGLNEGDPANELNLADLVVFTDWRNDASLNSFTAHKDYYKYYGVTKIECEDVLKITTDWGGKDGATVEEAFGAEQANKIVKFNSKTATPDGINTPDYGTVTYIKTSKAEIKEYKLHIPLTITYKWGTIREEVITVTVKATK